MADTNQTDTSQSAAVLTVLYDGALPGWRWLALAGRLPGAGWLIERMYRLFLRWRPMLQRWAASSD